MNKIQQAQLDSMLNTDLLLEGATNIWNLPGYGKFVINVGEFRGKIPEIVRYQLLQVTDVGGARRFAKLARKAMAEKSVKVRSAVQNFASDTGDTLLFQQVRFAKSKLLYSGIIQSLAYAKVIEAKARPIIVSLAPYNLTTDQLDAYLLSIGTFENAASQVDVIRVKRMNATEKLKVLFPATREIIETKLRTGATQFMETAPDFYQELLNSFSINSYPTHFTEFEIMTKDKATGEGIGGVRITATSDKGTMQQFSNPIGLADFQQFESAWWTITYECPGYKNLTMPNIKADLGIKLELVAELEKES